MLVERVLEVNSDALAEYDRVADFHHRCLQVQTEKDVGFLGVGDFAFEIFAQFLDGHGARINHLSLLKCDVLLEDLHATRILLGDELDGNIGGLSDGGGLLGAIEIAFCHVGNVSPTCLRPDAKSVRILLRVRLNWLRDPAVRVSFTQDRVDGRSHDSLVLGLNFGLVLRLGLFRIQWHVVALAAQFGNAILQLVQRSGDVRQFDDVGVWRFGQVAQVGQIVRNTLGFLQGVRKQGKDPAGQTDVAGNDVDVCGSTKLGHNGIQAVRGQCRSLVRFSVDDRSLRIGNRVVSVVGRRRMHSSARGRETRTGQTAHEGTACTGSSQRQVALRSQRRSGGDRGDLSQHCLRV
mmetsp:Transcript_7139/g.21055  ORF Transcript_7139/g.21055 Transcript_7139/m.21055 type:complete len:349 (+) Transcript_7139:1502-2548(+)